MGSLLLAVGKCAWREASSLGSVQGNNLFYCVVLLSMQPESAILPWLIIACLLAVPALLTPLAKIPEFRLEAMPLGKKSKGILRVFVKPALSKSPWLWGLPVLEMRQMARTLDFCFALSVALGATAYRYLSSAPVEEAIPVLSLIVTISLSTLAQNLFTLDAGARIRWKLAPRKGFTVLWRKGRYLLGLNALLTLGLDPIAATAGMLAALAIGHHTSVLSPTESPAWRFSAGKFFPHGLVQLVACMACGISVSRGDWLYLLGAGVAYGGSLVLYGWVLEKT